MPDDYYVSQYSGEEIDALLGGAGTGTVRYDAAQTLTDAQKTQARTNIAAAPSRFGLGEDPKYIADANDAVKNGWYAISSDTLNLPEPNGVWSYTYLKVDVGDRPDTYIKQTITSPYQSWHQCEVTRCFYSARGGWQPWEWVNPPMLLGVEYRTTERYLGKPVYAKTIDCGTVPLNTQKTVSMGVSGQLNKIRCNAWATSSSDAFTIPRKISGTEVTVTAASSANNIYISSNTDTLANYTIYATVYYTKATD